MRQIRYRAYIKAAKTIVIVQGINFEKQFILVGGEIKTRYEFQDIELMQLTGLLDKNGKEVFEGDIVSVWRAGSNRKFTIKWRESGVPMYILYPQPMNEDFWHCRSDMEMSWEIIGNVYENPELLSKN